MSDVFPDTFAFDIDRYKPPHNEHFSPGCAPYGLGTRMCLGFRWMELQPASLYESEQEAEVPHSRTRARDTRLSERRNLESWH